MSNLLSSSSPWIEAAVIVVGGALVAAGIAAFVNFVMRRLLDDSTRAGNVAGSVFWVVTGIGLLVAVGRLAEPDATQTGLEAAASRLLTALPDLLIGLLVLVLGWALAVAVRGVLRQVSGQFEIAWGGWLPTAAYWSVLVLAGLVAADQVGVQVGVLRAILLVGIGGAVLAAALAVGLGARPVLAEVAAGRHVTRIVAVGDEVEVAGHRGVVDTLGYTSVRLRTARGAVEVPNAAFLAAPVRILDEGTL